MVKKRIVALAIAGIMALGISQNVHACTWTSGCSEYRISVVCGYKLPSNLVTHVVVEPNGYQAKCLVCTVSSNHNINCRGCGAFLYEQTLACSESHSHKQCTDKVNMCQPRN